MTSIDNRMEITVSEVDGSSTLVIRGEVDLVSAPRLAAEVAKLTEAGRRDVRVDLRDVSFMDSQGINVLAGAHKRLLNKGGTLRVVALSLPVRRVLEITGVDRVVPIDGG